MKNSKSIESRFSVLIIFFISFIIISFARLFLIRQTIFNVDEAIFSTNANMLLHGILSIPFIGNVGISSTYAFIFMLFGSNNMIAIHLFAIFVLFIICIFIFLILKSLDSPKSAYIGAFLFSICTNTYNPSDLYSLSSEWMVLFFFVPAVYLFIRYIYTNVDSYLFYSGTLCALATISKQPALFLSLFTFCFLIFVTYIYKRNCLKPAVNFGAGFLSIFILLLLLLSLKGQALSYLAAWFIGTNYIQMVSFSEKLILTIMSLFKHEYFKMNYLVYIGFIAQAIICLVDFFNKWRDRKEITARDLTVLYVILWGAVSYFCISLSGRFYGHYFIFIIPALCISSALLFSDFICEGKKLLKSEKAGLNIFILLIFVIYIFRAFTIPVLSVRHFYQNYPQNEFYMAYPLHTVADYISRNTQKSDALFAWGFPPDMYVYTNRDCENRCFDCSYLTGGFGKWVMPDSAQATIQKYWDIFINDLKEKPPKYFVDTSVSNRYGFGQYPIRRYARLASFIENNYVLEKQFVADGKVISNLYRYQKQ